VLLPQSNNIVSLFRWRISVFNDVSSVYEQILTNPHISIYYSYNISQPGCIHCLFTVPNRSCMTVAWNNNK
jgi:hypothetical protein